MDSLSIRFLIGLSSPADPCAELSEERAPARSATALGILSTHYPFGGAYHGRGVWKGSSEPCMMFETIEQGDRETLEERARYVARYLKNILGQDAVGIVFAPVTFELV